MDRRADEAKANHNAPVSPSVYVRKFHDMVNIETPDQPDSALLGNRRLARKIKRMLRQEVREVKKAIAARDIGAVGIELADVVYAAFGAALELGIDLDEKIRQVHEANLTRMSPEGDVRRSKDGKIKKGLHYIPPEENS